MIDVFLQRWFLDKLIYPVGTFTVLPGNTVTAASDNVKAMFDGLTIIGKFTAIVASGSNLRVNSLTARPITRNGRILRYGDIQPGHIGIFKYSASSTCWEMLTEPDQLSHDQLNTPLTDYVIGTGAGITADTPLINTISELDFLIKRAANTATVGGYSTGSVVVATEWPKITLPTSMITGGNKIKSGVSLYYWNHNGFTQRDLSNAAYNSDGTYTIVDTLGIIWQGDTVNYALLYVL